MEEAFCCVDWFLLVRPLPLALCSVASGSAVVPVRPSDWCAVRRVGQEVLPPPHGLLHVCTHSPDEDQPMVRVCPPCICACVFPLQTSYNPTRSISTSPHETRMFTYGCGLSDFKQNGDELRHGPCSNWLSCALTPLSPYVVHYLNNNYRGNSDTHCAPAILSGVTCMCCVIETNFLFVNVYDGIVFKVLLRAQVANIRHTSQCNGYHSCLLIKRAVSFLNKLLQIITFYLCCHVCPALDETIPPL